MRLSDIIFVPSVQHTGTWFVIEFLRHFVPSCVSLSRVIDGMGAHAPMIVHGHFPISDGFGAAPSPDEEFSVPVIKTMAGLFPTVIPVRDPFAAILTREIRHPNLRHFFIVNNFTAIAQVIMGHPNVMFLPVDLPWTAEEREAKLLAILAHCGISSDGHEEWVRKFAEEWQAQNVTPGNRYKELYRAKDVDHLRFLLGPKWAEVAYLQNMAAVIHPFLAHCGYTRGDLLP